VNGFIRWSLLILLVGLCGCFPEQRFWWSPQGDRALVLVEDRLHLVEVGGELGDPLAMEGGGAVRSVSWLADGSGFVCQRELVLKSWAEAKALIATEEVDVVEALEPAVLSMFGGALHGSGDRDFLNELIKGMGYQRLMAALMLVYEQKPTEVKEVLGSTERGREILTALGGKDAGFVVHEICRVGLEGRTLSKPVSLARGMLKAPMFPKVSPKGRAVAFLRINSDGEHGALEVVSLDGGVGLKVSERVSLAFDWMADGERLVYAAALGGNDGPLQTVQQVRVVQGQGNGALVKPPYERNAEGVMVRVKGEDRLADPQVLLTAILLHRPVLQGLPDGRVLMVSQAAEFPAVGGGMELDPRLYLIAADGKSMEKVDTAPGALPTDLSYVVASPDGKRVAVVESETDAVAVVEMSTGKVEMVSPAHERWSCRTLPRWKSADELTFAALDQKGRPKWWLWTEGQATRCLNESWSDEASATWLKFEEEQEGKLQSVSEGASALSQ
jgi:hypothetical protein